MFEQTFIEKRRRNPLAMLSSFAIDCLLVGALVLLPLVYTEAIPRMVPFVNLSPPVSRGPDRPAKPEQPAGHVAPTQQSNFDADRLVAPHETPTRIVQVVDRVATEGPSGPPDGAPWGSIPSGTSGGSSTIMSVIGTRRDVPQPPPPQPQAQPEKMPRHLVGGDVIQALALYQPSPVYPAIARTARIEGTVRLAAYVSERGTIEELRVIDGPALLINAALEAVRTWRYRPLLLNGAPSKVDTTIEVHFRLN